MKQSKNIGEMQPVLDGGVWADDSLGKSPDISSEENYWVDRRTAGGPYKGEDRRKPRDLRARGNNLAMPTSWGTSLRFRLRRSHRLLSIVILLIDAVALHLSLIIPSQLFGLFEARAVESSHYLTDAYGLFLFVAVFFLGWNWIQGNYTKKCSLSDELARLFKAIFIAIGVQAILAGFYGHRYIMMGLLMTWLMAAILVPLVRISVKRVMFGFGMWTRPTVVIGAGDNALATAKAIQSDWLLGCHVVEFLRVPVIAAGVMDSATNANSGGLLEFIEVNGHKIPVRNVQRLDGELFRRLGNPHIVVATDSLDFWDVIKMLYEQEVPYTTLDIAPSISGIPISGIGVSCIFRHDILLMRVQNNLAQFMPQLIKRVFDVVTASVLLLLLSPFLLVFALLVSFSGKNVIYGHERVGRNGRLFKCYKFRSMVNNSEEVLARLLRDDPEAKKEWERDFKLKNDPRITWIGRFMRENSVDELPQLVNVIKGDMSLVGPRPVIAEELDRYQDKKSYYYMVRPGITGLWQISGRSDLSYSERVNLDFWYSRNWSLWHDLFILFRTVHVVAGKSGAY